MLGLFNRHQYSGKQYHRKKATPAGPQIGIPFFYGCLCDNCRHFNSIFIVSAHFFSATFRSSRHFINKRCSALFPHPFMHSLGLQHHHHVLQWCKRNRRNLQRFNHSVHRLRYLPYHSLFCRQRSGQRFGNGLVSRNRLLADTGIFILQGSNLRPLEFFEDLRGGEGKRLKAKG